MRLCKLLIVVFLVTSLWAESSNLPLWKVKGNKNTIYLMGSLHLMPKEGYPLDPVIYELLEKADTAVFEVDIDEAVGLPAQLYIMSKSQLEKGQKLTDVLTPEVYTACKNEFASLGGSIGMVQTMKPFFVGLTLSVLKMQKLGYNPELGIDKHIHSIAKKKGKGVKGLETIKEQFDMILSIAGKNESEYMQHTLDELQQIEVQLKDMYSSWSNGDIKKLDEMVLSSFKEYPEIKTLLLDKRNENWMVHIRSYLKQKKDYFIVVGAAHMAGDKGLVSLLSKAGFSCTQIKRK